MIARASQPSVHSDLPGTPCAGIKVLDVVVESQRAGEGAACGFTTIGAVQQFYTRCVPGLTCSDGLRAGVCRSPPPQPLGSATHGQPCAVDADCDADGRVTGYVERCVDDAWRGDDGDDPADASGAASEAQSSGSFSAAGSEASGSDGEARDDPDDGARHCRFAAHGPGEDCLSDLDCDPALRCLEDGFCWGGVGFRGNCTVIGRSLHSGEVPQLNDCATAGLICEPWGSDGLQDVCQEPKEPGRSCDFDYHCTSGWCGDNGRCREARTQRARQPAADPRACAARLAFDAVNMSCAAEWVDGVGIGDECDPADMHPCRSFATKCGCGGAPSPAASGSAASGSADDPANDDSTDGYDGGVMRCNSGGNLGAWYAASEALEECAAQNGCRGDRCIAARCSDESANFRCVDTRFRLYQSIGMDTPGVQDVLDALKVCPRVVEIPDIPDYSGAARRQALSFVGSACAVAAATLPLVSWRAS